MVDVVAGVQGGDEGKGGVRSARAVVAPVVAGGAGAGHQERGQAVVCPLDQVGEDVVVGILGTDEIWYRTGYRLVGAGSAG